MLVGGRAVAILAAALALAGCSKANQVRSTGPLVMEQASLILRAGVWASPDEDCAFEPKASLKTWPDCAWGARRGGDAFNARWSMRGMVQGSRLAGGNPMIRQSHLRFTAKGQGDERLYDYEALRPLQRDGKGRVTAYETWTVMCGPNEAPARAISEPQAAADAATAPAAPRVLPPGLEARGGSGCLARDLAAVRNAAVLTRAEGWDVPRTSYFVRPFRFRDNFGRQKPDPPEPAEAG